MMAPAQQTTVAGAGLVVPPLLSTGVPGLDAVLAGGLLVERLYLLEGEPGTGKTTGAASFSPSARAGERSALHRPGRIGHRAARRSPVARLGPAGIAVEESGARRRHPRPRAPVHHLPPVGNRAGVDHPRILAAIEKHHPARLVLDSLSELQLLAENPALPAPGHCIQAISGQPALHHHPHR
jgi:circadian clock protein KaiC